jgi:hypothetical protein
MQKAAREIPRRLFCVSILFFLTSSGAGVSHSAPYGRAPEEKTNKAVKGPPGKLTGIFAARLLGFFSASPPFARGAVLPLKKGRARGFPARVSCHSKGPRRGPGKIYKIEGGHMARKSKAFDHSKYANWIDPATAQPYERNAKIHTDKQVQNIVNSIQRFGWQQDTVLTADNVLVIGHGRRLAALKIGCEMPYHRIDKKADALTDADIRELRIADNQTNAETGMDFSELEAEIEDLSFDGFDFDFGIVNLNEEFDESDLDDDTEKSNVIVNNIAKIFLLISVLLSLFYSIKNILN